MARLLFPHCRGSARRCGRGRRNRVFETFAVLRGTYACGDRAARGLRQAGCSRISHSRVAATGATADGGTCRKHGLHGGGERSILLWIARGSPLCNRPVCEYLQRGDRRLLRRTGGASDLPAPRIADGLDPDHRDRFARRHNGGLCLRSRAAGDLRTLLSCPPSQAVKGQLPFRLRERSGRADCDHAR